jgi:hypothetical protein
VQVTLDKAGRICLPDEMARAAVSRNEAVLVGRSTRFEIWNPARYEKCQGRRRGAGIRSLQTDGIKNMKLGKLLASEKFCERVQNGFVSRSQTGGAAQVCFAEKSICAIQNAGGKSRCPVRKETAPALARRKSRRHRLAKNLATLLGKPVEPGFILGARSRWSKKRCRRADRAFAGQRESGPQRFERRGRGSCADQIAPVGIRNRGLTTPGQKILGNFGRAAFEGNRALTNDQNAQCQNSFTNQ